MEKSILWGWRKIGSNYPYGEDMLKVSIFPDLIDKKVKDLNNSPDGMQYERVKITIEKA